jgi:predicted NBD/HSP70 family sugar kinase
VKTLEHVAHYLGIGLANIVTGLAPQVVIIVGEVTAAWDRIGPIVLDVVKRRTLRTNTTPIVPTDPATQPRLRGAVTLVVQEHFGAPNVA